MNQVQTAPFTTKGFDFVMFLAEDMSRARKFYESLFQIQPGEFDSAHFVEYSLPDGNAFAIGHNPGAPHTPGGGIMFNVEDADAAAERVVSLGGKVAGNFSGPNCKTAWCKDTEGNSFGLHERI